MGPLDNEFFRQSSNVLRDSKKDAKSNLVPGVDPAMLNVGDRVTISQNLITGDRSWTDTVHEVLAVNSCHIQTRMERKCSYAPSTLLLLAHEHHFYVADHFARPEMEAK